MSNCNTVEKLTELLDSEPNNTELLIERGKLYHQAGEHHKALNDFIRASETAPENKEAQAYINLLNNIFEYTYMEKFNV